MAAKVLSIHAPREQQISCCAMNNQSLDENINHEQSAFPIFRTATFLSLLFLAVGLLVFMFKGPGLLLLFILLGGDFCC